MSAYDNALAESTIGLFKNEAIRESSPFRNAPLRTIDDVEWITAGWVDWYNTRRLHSTLGDVPPDELEAAYYAGYETPSHSAMAIAQKRHQTGDDSHNDGTSSAVLPGLDPVAPASR